MTAGQGQDVKQTVIRLSIRRNGMTFVISDEEQVFFITKIKDIID